MTRSSKPRKPRKPFAVYKLALTEVRFWERQADNRFYDLRNLLAELRDLGQTKERR